MAGIGGRRYRLVGWPMMGLLARGPVVARLVLIVVGVMDKDADMVRAVFALALIAVLAQCLLCLIRSRWEQGVEAWIGIWILALTGAALVPLGWLLWLRRVVS